MSSPSIPILLPAYAQPRESPASWQPKKYLQPPQPPPIDEAHAKELEVAAQTVIGRESFKEDSTEADCGLRWWNGKMGSISLRLDSIQVRKLRPSPYHVPWMRPAPPYIIDLLPPKAYSNNASTSLCTKFVHTSTNKIRCPVNVVTWTPEGRRILTGSTSGEFTLWNGLTFNFETILQAHDSAIRALRFSHSGAYIASADQSGIVKYFQPNMNNLTAFTAHRESVRGLSFAPNDERFATASDDATVRIWAFEESREERVLTGHGWDVKCVEWHPTKGLLVSGSKDNLVKFWDPRTGTCLSTFHQHKNTVQAVAWSPNGDLVASASRDQTIRVFDIRAMKEYRILKGHKKEVCSGKLIPHTAHSALTWHPVHSLLVSGGSEGAILHWDLSAPQPSFNDMLSSSSTQPGPRATISEAHDSNVWSLAYHPLGHLLVSGSNDHTTRFWSRERPGDATSVFSGGGARPPAGEEEEEQGVPGFMAWQGEEDYGEVPLPSITQDGYGQMYNGLGEDGIPGIPGLGGSSGPGPYNGSGGGNGGGTQPQSSVGPQGRSYWGQQSSSSGGSGYRRR